MKRGREAEENPISQEQPAGGQLDAETMCPGRELREYVGGSSTSLHDPGRGGLTGGSKITGPGGSRRDGERNPSKPRADVGDIEESKTTSQGLDDQKESQDRERCSSGGGKLQVDVGPSSSSALQNLRSIRKQQLKVDLAEKQRHLERLDQIDIADQYEKTQSFSIILTGLVVSSRWETLGEMADTIPIPSGPIAVAGNIGNSILKYLESPPLPSPPITSINVITASAYQEVFFGKDGTIRMRSLSAYVDANRPITKFYKETVEHDEFRRCFAPGASKRALFVRCCNRLVKGLKCLEVTGNRVILQETAFSLFFPRDSKENRSILSNLYRVNNFDGIKAVKFTTYSGVYTFMQLQASDEAP